MQTGSAAGESVASAGALAASQVLCHVLALSGWIWS